MTVRSITLGDSDADEDACSDTPPHSILKAVLPAPFIGTANEDVERGWRSVLVDQNFEMRRTTSNSTRLNELIGYRLHALNQE
jgi:hypothetical protein